MHPLLSDFNNIEMHPILNFKNIPTLNPSQMCIILLSYYSKSILFKKQAKQRDKLLFGKLSLKCKVIEKA